jgi:hypothetical protein
MSYVLTGRLRAHGCGGGVVPIANATLMIYRKLDDDGPAGFALRTHEQIRDRDYALMCQGRTDGNGEFRLDFTEKTVFGHRGSTHVYAGGPIVVDAVVRAADGDMHGRDAEPVQFTVGSVEPSWSADGGSQAAHWEREVSESEWGQVREALDAWTILGRVVRADTKQPVAGAKVSAYDADLVQDDFLGSVSTDADGRFRIDFPGSAFREMAGGVSMERGGPEVYFHVEAADGTVLLKEPKSRGNKPDRAESSNCLSVEIEVEGVASTV